MKKILIYTLVTIAVFGLCGIATISIQAKGINRNYPNIIQDLAERFNLNVDEVKEFFDQNQTERIQERLAETGLTEEQIESLRAKQKELREERGLLESLSPEEKMAKRQERKEEMESWAKENGIDFSFLGRFNNRADKGFRRLRQDTN